MRISGKIVYAIGASSGGGGWGRGPLPATRGGQATDQKKMSIFGISVEKGLGKGGGWF